MYSRDFPGTRYLVNPAVCKQSALYVHIISCFVGSSTFGVPAIIWSCLRSGALSWNVVRVKKQRGLCELSTFREMGSNILFILVLLA